MMLKTTVLLLIISSAVASLNRAVGDYCPLFCNHLQDHLLCGSDKQTYRNKCYFHQAQCRDQSLTLAHEGACMSARRGIICTTPWCLPTYEPVCGSDGKTYGNECYLNNEMCNDESLKVEHKGTCTPTFP